DAGRPLRLIETTVDINDRRKRAMVDRVIAACGGSVEGKTIALLGLTFKPNTDDMREAPSIELFAGLVRAGASIRAYDPQGMKAAAPLMPGITFGRDPYDAVEGADALVIVTEWDEFRALDLPRI